MQVTCVYGCALALLTLLTLFVTPTAALAGRPPDEHTFIAAADWLNGRGVEVFYTPDPDQDHPQNDDGTIQYECVELAVRLYDTLGYTQTWPIHWAYEVADMAGQAGFQDWVFTANGGKAPPDRGDIVVWPNEYNSGTGHVAIVNLVTITTTSSGGDGRVQVVHQNIWRGNAPRPLSELTLWRDQSGHYNLASLDGVMPMGWVHSPRMYARLQRATSVKKVISR